MSLGIMVCMITGGIDLSTVGVANLVSICTATLMKAVATEENEIAVYVIPLCFVIAILMGAAAGAGGIGFNLFMAGSFYFDLHEMGMLTYIVVIAVVLLEMLSTKIKAKVR